MKYCHMRLRHLKQRHYKLRHYKLRHREQQHRNKDNERINPVVLDNHGNQGNHVAEKPQQCGPLAYRLLTLLILVTVFPIAIVSYTTGTLNKSVLSIADPVQGPFVPTITRKTSKTSRSVHTTPRRTTKKTTPRPLPTTSTHSRTVPTTRPTTPTPSSTRSTIPTTHSAIPSASRTSRASSSGSGSARGSGSGTGSGVGSGSHVGNGPGGFVHNFDPCSFSPADFTAVGLLPLTPRGLSFADSSIGGRIQWSHEHGGIPVTESSCRYADTDDTWHNHHVTIGKIFYQGTERPLSPQDFRTWASNEATYFCNSRATFNNIDINGNSAIEEREYDRFGNLIKYLIYVKGLVFAIGVTNVCHPTFELNWGQHVPPSDQDKLLNIVRSNIPHS